MASEDGFVVSEKKNFLKHFPIGAYVKLTGLKGKRGLGGKHIFIIDWLVLNVNFSSISTISWNVNLLIVT